MANSGSTTVRPADDETQPVDPDMLAIERAMNRIRRRQARRTLGRSANEGLTQPVNLDHVAVVDAIEEGTEIPGNEVTVGDVGERLGIDPSRASRIVSAAIKAGYVRRVASQSDGRRIGLELTPAGEGIVGHAHRYRQALYDRLLEDWSPRDRAEFARLLTRFTDALTGANRR
jgi:DNA-binding MarR family transcriptional regulator